MIEFNFVGLTGEIITRNNFEYEENRKGWNRAIEKYPLAIVYCSSEDDIVNSITWAKLNSIDIRIRSGGHHYEGYSNGNDVLIIDVSRMNSIYIDQENNAVKIQGGVRNKEVYEALGKEGHPFPGGGCPTVGVCGLVLGGGWGYSARLLGLACDKLREVEIIDYKGKRIICDDNLNEDLFWACRGGGGGNFGVVISMTFELPPKIKMATLINIDYKNSDIEEKIKVLETFQNIFKDLDRSANLKISIYNSKYKGEGIHITGLLYGDETKANIILEPFKNISKNFEIDLNYITVMQANKIIQDSHPDYESYKSTGRFVYKDYSISEMENIIKLVNSRPKGSIYTAVSIYGLGGAIADINKNKTAFYYRDAKFIMGLQSVWEDSKYEQINRAWFKEKFKEVNSITKGSYINFPVAEIQHYEAQYYDENLDKLKKIKKKYDPKGIFHFEQAIRSLK